MGQKQTTLQKPLTISLLSEDMNQAKLSRLLNSHFYLEAHTRERKKWTRAPTVQKLKFIDEFEGYNHTAMLVVSIHQWGFIPNLHETVNSFLIFHLGFWCLCTYKLRKITNSKHTFNLSTDTSTCNKPLFIQEYCKGGTLQFSWHSVSVYSQSVEFSSQSNGT